GGSLGRNEATARGCLFAAQRALARGVVAGRDKVEGARVAIQGFGNAGAIAARLFQEAGARVIAVSDSRGGVVRTDGLDLKVVADHKAQSGSVVGTPGTQKITNEQLILLDCDILIPAALENQIRLDNARRVRARFICEAANGPTTPGADRILFERGIPLLPDILANSGGVCVSYFEWVQNNENEQWDLEEVNNKLRTKMERATDAVLAKQEQINHGQTASPPKNADGKKPKASGKKAKGDAARPAGLGPVDLRTAALIV